MTKKTLLGAAETKLQRHVANWLWAEARGSYDGDVRAVLKDLFYGGCASGMVGHLIYTRDTVAFYRRHRAEIAALLKDLSDNTGESYPAALRDFDKDDPLCLGTANQNLLAWLGFEESARALAYRLEIEV